jgi:hypothetical protein
MLSKKTIAAVSETAFLVASLTVYSLLVSETNISSVRWIGGSDFCDGLVSHIRKAAGGDNYQGHESSRRTSVVSETGGVPRQPRAVVT